MASHSSSAGRNDGQRFTKQSPHAALDRTEKSFN